MIENISREELAGDPDKYLRLLKEKREELRRELAKIGKEVTAMEQVKRWGDKIDQWAESGIPEPRRAEPDPREEPRDSTHAQAPTRKARIMALMGQDPQRTWKVSDVAGALNEESKAKCVRVAMDELARAGSLMKLPGAVYQFGRFPQD
ncbi:hypothetical protein [Streptomyces sp. WMMB 322]|uniref:hypothetical protein n=1 Tax=Streptomyces sp. WMMB 322 TaxID=1286821 RepID=UPI0006E271CB|nr:hypothetical protein [Streptomyces sp. WMMB 322]SCK15252.1 hypothetical protein H180DRAFT_01003 [Streptomyces sp. WMMB 322]